MQYTTLGRTGLKVSVAGLGCGGFSRLGLGTGQSAEHAAGIVRQAIDLGVDTDRHRRGVWHRGGGRDCSARH